MEEIRWLEKARVSEAFFLLKGEFPNFLRRSACLWAAETQVLLPGKALKNNGYIWQVLVGVPYFGWGWVTDEMSH